jgi:hypothetical protein
MQFGVASHGAHIETVDGFLEAEKFFSRVDAMARRSLNGLCGLVNVVLFGLGPVLARILLQASG